MLLLSLMSCLRTEPNQSSQDDTLTVHTSCDAIVVSAGVSKSPQTGEDAISWSASTELEIVSVVVVLDVDENRILLPQINFTSGLEHRIPYTGNSTEAELSISIELKNGMVCQSTPKTIALRVYPTTDFDDVIHSVEIDTNLSTSEACSGFLLDTIQPAAQHLGEDGNAAGFRVWHPCSGVVLMEGQLSASTLEHSGISKSAQLAEVSFIPPESGLAVKSSICTEQGCFIGSLETVPGLVPGTLIGFDPETGVVLGTLSTWTNEEYDVANLHHGLRVVYSSDYSDIQDVVALGWTSHEICERDGGYPSTIRTTLDLITGETKKQIEESFNVDVVDCDALNGAPYHYYGHSLGNATRDGNAGTCASFIEVGSNNRHGGFVHWALDGEESVILQENLAPRPISPQRAATRGQIPAIDPFLHAVSLRQESDVVQLWLLTLGDVDGDYEMPTVWSMLSEETLPGENETRYFTTRCTYEFSATDDPIRHHGSVFPLDEGTIFALYPRGDAPVLAVFLDGQTCDVLGTISTKCGASCSSSDVRYPRWTKRLEGYPADIGPIKMSK